MSQYGAFENVNFINLLRPWSKEKSEWSEKVHFYETFMKFSYSDSWFLGLWKTWKTWKCPGISFSDLENLDNLEITWDFMQFSLKITLLVHHSFSCNNVAVFTDIFCSENYHCRGKITWNLGRMSPGKPGNNLEFHLTKVLRTMIFRRRRPKILRKCRESS